jgi:epoxyqueuosine reductase
LGEVLKKPVGLQQGRIDAIPKVPRLKMPFALTILMKLRSNWQAVKKDYLEETGNPPEKVQEVPPEFWREVETKAKELGIGLISYAPVEEELIFQRDTFSGYDVKHLYSGGIVLGMEMDFEDIETAPEFPAGKESARVYAELGEATLRLTEFIRQKGVRAIACHPFGGQILYPAMAVRAGLGEIGRNGLLITKQFGPRQRLSMISINASPLPQAAPHDSTISEFCETCGICIKECPTKAIYEKPREGTAARIDGAKCMPCFIEKMGCSICIKVCPLHNPGYEKAMAMKRTSPK